MTTTAKKVRPVDAAGLVLIRTGKDGEPEILLGRRHTKAGFLPDIYVVPANREVTVRDLLTHTGGLQSGGAGTREGDGPAGLL